MSASKAKRTNYGKSVSHTELAVVAQRGIAGVGVMQADRSALLVNFQVFARFPPRGTCYSDQRG